MLPRANYLRTIIGAFLLVTGSAHAVDFVPGQVLVKLRGDATVVERAQVQSEADAVSDKQVAKVVGGAEIHLLKVRGTVEATLQKLRRSSAVEYAEPNYIVHTNLMPNDPSYGNLWDLKNTGQVIGGIAGKPGADISAEAAWNVTTGSATVVVGVVDTGIDYNHPDLAANIWANPGGIGGCAVGTYGYNALNSTCDPLDDNDHGSHVSGTIGARGNNSVGIAGVNWAVSIMGLKFLDASGSGTTAGAIAAIDFAVKAKIAGVNVRVLSNSWGGGGFSQALLDEINKANANGILFVAAAGNSGTNNDVTPHYPSSYNTPNMIAVAATDNNDKLAYFSNYGATSVQLGAPGVDIYSTVRNRAYAFFSGTSMATPHVAGTAALVLAAQPSLGVAELKAALLNNVDRISTLSGFTTTGGRLNASKSVGTAPRPPDFSLAATPASQSVAAGAPASYTVGVNRSGGFSGAVTLSVVSVLPSGTTASFNPNPTSGTTSTLNVATTASTPPGSYTLTINGVSGPLNRSTSVVLTVTGAAPPPPPPDPQGEN